MVRICFEDSFPHAVNPYNNTLQIIWHLAFGIKHLAFSISHGPSIVCESIPHEFPISHSLKATGQCVIEHYPCVVQFRPFCQVNTLGRALGGT